MHARWLLYVLVQWTDVDSQWFQPVSQWVLQIIIRCPCYNDNNECTKHLNLPCTFETGMKFAVRIRVVGTNVS